MTPRPNAPPNANELFAFSRSRVERFEPLTVGCLTSYRVTDGETVAELLDFNMLNALERAAHGEFHTAFDITFHSPTRWTCHHRLHGYVLKVWGWQQEQTTTA